MPGPADDTADPGEVVLPDEVELDRLNISPEVAYFLVSRGIPLPDCPPQWKTPEPRDLPGAVFDPARVDRVLKVFGLLRHTQGKWAGRQLIPDPWQVAYILAPVFGWVRRNSDGDVVRIIRSAFVDVSRKNGKGVDADEDILTGDGWRRFGDLRVGDQVHAVDGTLTRISYVSPTRVLSCFRVSFADGQSIVVDRDHQWRVFDRWGHGGRDWSVTDRRAYIKGAWRTLDMATLAASFDMHRPTHREFRYSVRMDRVLGRPEADLPIDPYLLGLWLGDGATRSARISSADPEIPATFADAGYQVRRIGATKYDYGIRGGFLAALRNLGVLGDKHVPEGYLLASEKQRLALLQGLMDTDGTASFSGNSGAVSCVFTSTNRRLADAALFLARSLGWKPTLREGRASLYGKDCGPVFDVMFAAYRDQPPFRLQRKIDRLRLRPARALRSATNKIVAVEPVPPRPTRCIQVEHGERQFLVGRGLLPTHNTTLAGGIATYMTAADGEAGAQVYAVAAGKDQARFCFDPVKAIAEKSPALSPHVKVVRDRIIHKASGSYFAVVSSVADLMHGANVAAAIVDEAHVHRTPELIEAVETGTGARAQPLVVIITTADDGRTDSVYDRKRKYVEQLARGAIEDPTAYGVVWGAFGGDASNPPDDPFIEATWRKANPGYGISPTREFMEAAARKARQSPADLASFLRLHLGIRTKQQTKFLTLESWDANAGMVDETALAGRRCFGGLDLANVSDLCALCWLFPDDAGGYDAIWRLWTPEEQVRELDKRTAGAAAVWIREGWLRTTPGNVTDYEYIKLQMGRDADAFEVLDVAYDRWNASQLVNDLVADGLPMSPLGQGVVSMTAPTKELQRLLLQGNPETPLLRHGGNPAMRWQVDNFAVVMDPAGNVKPAKNKSGDKIDGVVALIGALERAMRSTEGPSVYEQEDRGLLVL